MPTKQSRRAFTLCELVVVVVLLALVLLLPGLMRRNWNASGLDGSLNNVRQLLAATAQYRMDNADRVPMRGCRYTQGVMSAWDTWNSFGKNCSTYWLAMGSSSGFDEHAYGRPLNRYLPFATHIPRPAGYVNTGSGNTWTFIGGTITAQQRAALQNRVCQSPGDRATRQRDWPNATPGVSGYDDVGTSYVLNMKWWPQVGWPSNFTQHFNAGTERIRNLRPDDYDRPFAWIHDQTADVVFNFVNAQSKVKGEFGGVNKSVMGFLTGDADYLTVTPRAGYGIGYTFLLDP